jgi:F-box and WD-40 domain protein 1/11
MATYEESPPDEGYSEDPLTVGQSGSMPAHLARLTVQERTGKGGIGRDQVL